MRKLFIIVICLMLLSNVHATLTRVRSLGDVESPVTGRISGLIKDDIVDIYFNPARVNDVKAFLILTSFYLDYGTDAPEKEETYKETTGTKPKISLEKIERQRYDLCFNTGVLVPIKFFNIFINYDPRWIRYDKKKTTTDISGFTNYKTEASEHSYTDSQLPFDVTLGFNILDIVMFGLRTGYYNYSHDESVTFIDGTINKKSEFQKDRVILGTGVKFNFLKHYSLSIVADVDLSQKDESPLKVLGTSEDNYEPDDKVYQYTTTEYETDINLRLIPEIYIGGSKNEFIRIMAEASIIDYKKDFHFIQQSILSNYDVFDDSDKKYIASFGASFNHILSASTKAIYGIKYSGLIKGLTHVKYYTDKNDKTTYTDNKIEENDNYGGIFVGFDTEITKYLFIRTGLSQGIYRYSLFKTIKTTVVSAAESVSEKKTINEYFLPETTFCLGFYIQPVTDFVIEFNFSGSRDWNPENISYYKEVNKENGEETDKVSKRNYDCNIGVSLSYKI